MASQLDHYAVLEVSPDASHEQIKKAYRAQALICHPDRGGSPYRMRRLNEAWAVLGDAELRRRYDQDRRLTSPGASNNSTRSPAHHRPSPVQHGASPLADLLRNIAYWTGWTISRIGRIVSRLFARKA